MITNIRVALFSILISVASLLAISSPLLAADSLEEVCKEGNNSSSQLCKDYLGTKSPAGTNPMLKLFKNITNIMSFIAGVLAVIFVMFGGFKYITSAGDAQKTASGRQTLIYALVGLIVVVISRQLILYVLGKVIT